MESNKFSWEETLHHTHRWTNTNTPSDPNIKLDKNTGSISLKDLRSKKTYLKRNTCSDGREDDSGIASFGGAAGTIIAMYCALRDLLDAQADNKQIMDILTELVWDIKIYLHDDTHAQSKNWDEHPCDCKHIWCGAVNCLLRDDTKDDHNERWLDKSEREAFRERLKWHTQIKVLSDDHEEKSIYWIKNQIEKEWNSKQGCISIVTKNKKDDGQQDFVYHETGRNLIIEYMAEDVVDILIQKIDHKLLKQYYDKVNPQNYSDDQKFRQILSYRLKQQTIKRADKHTILTAKNIPTARRALDTNNVVVIKNMDPNYWYNIWMGVEHL